jgi:hypothetical protein
MFRKAAERAFLLALISGVGSSARDTLAVTGRALKANNLYLLATVATAAVALSLMDARPVSAQVLPTSVCNNTIAGASNPFVSAGLAQIIGGVTAATNTITSVIGTMNTAFLAQQSSAFVAGLANPERDQLAGGTWGRLVGGWNETRATGTFSGGISSLVDPATDTFIPGATGQIRCNSDIRQTFAGVQAGQDLARLNIGGNGGNVHLGVTGGYAEANAQDTAGSNFTGNFQIPFIEWYATYTKGNFFADITGRWEFYQMNLFSPEAALANQRLNVLGFSLSGSMGYKFDLADNWFIEPSLGLIHSNVKVDALNMTGGFGDVRSFFFLPPGSVQFTDIQSTLGRLGIRIGKTVSMQNFSLQPFVAASVWHEFASNTIATYTAPPFTAGFFNLTNPPLGGLIDGTRVGTYGQYSLGVTGSPLNSNLIGYVRVDYKQGPNIDAWGLNANLRYQFDPSKKAAPRAHDKSPVLASVYDWSGFYLGGLIGAGWGKSKWSFPFAGTESNPTVAGGLGGIELGYNLQNGPWVVGAEADFAGTTARGGQSCENLPQNFPPGNFFPPGGANATTTFVTWGRQQPDSATLGTACFFMAKPAVPG